MTATLPTLAQVGIPSEVANVAGSPEQVILVAIGALMVLAASAVFGILAAGGIVEAIVKQFPSGGGPPESRR
ncbi:hypothetical protein [Halorarius halobius]|uniref:hypothetical protein n=1 Tax=Halorarius halobius TaxID=2962671 RepID=UPI0020CC6A10|nr:hypothetical protein [Halorarius halobius]